MKTLIILFLTLSGGTLVLAQRVGTTPKPNWDRFVSVADAHLRSIKNRDFDAMIASDKILRPWVEIHESNIVAALKRKSLPYTRRIAFTVLLWQGKKEESLNQLFGQLCASRGELFDHALASISMRLRAPETDTLPTSHLRTLEQLAILQTRKFALVRDALARYGDPSTLEVLYSLRNYNETQPKSVLKASLSSNLAKAIAALSKRLSRSDPSRTDR